jgi:hypothetical protein
MFLEEFLKQEMNQQFTLIFQVGKIEEVRRENVNNSNYK